MLFFPVTIFLLHPGDYKFTFWWSRSSTMSNSSASLSKQNDKILSKKIFDINSSMLKTAEEKEKKKS